jgi:poly-gamma-glutamate synthesis protein (capsule biosynthesis protein)
MIKKLYFFALFFVVFFLLSLTFNFQKKYIFNLKSNLNIKNQSVANNNKEFKILLAGDLMLDRMVKIKVDQIANGDFSFLFSNILDYLKSFDYVIVNLEGPISDKGVKVGSKYSFRMTPKILDSLKKANIKVFNLANNHIADYGQVAFLDTLDRLKKENFYYFGAGKNEYEAYSPLILNLNNHLVGILGFTEFLSHLQAKNNSPGIAFLEDKKFKEAIKKAREKVDILIVIFHWGEEYQKKPNQKQIYYARQAIDLGADLVIGHHPHIVQEIEVYKNKYIFYSLGNFIFDQNFSQETMKGGLVEVTIENKKIKDINFRYAYLNKNFQIENLSPLMKIYNLEEKVYKLLIAQNEKEWQQGLMFVKCPCDFDGMIFIFPDKQIRYFWNKNTYLDLDIYWLDDHKILGKESLPSIQKTKNIKTINSPLPANKVIEIINK